MSDRARNRPANTGPSSHPSVPYRPYVIALLAGFIAYIAAVFSINVWVDLHGTFRRSVLSHFDTYGVSTSRITKANLSDRGGNDIVVFGSSRSANALIKPPLRAAGHHFTNLALPNTSLAEIDKVVEFTLGKNKPREVVIGIEFDYFNYDFIPDEFWKSRFNPNLRASEFFLEESLSIYNGRKSIEAWSNGGNAQAGEPALSRLRKFEILLADATRLARDLPPPPRYDARKYALLRAMVDRSRQGGAEVSVVMMPVHATLLLAYEKLGLMTDFEWWKRDVVSALEGTGARVWDFNGSDPRQFEAIPAGVSDMTWFSDASHCTPLYGSWLLERIAEPSAIDDDARGVRLTSGNIEERLATVRRSLREARAIRPDLSHLADRIVDDDMARRRPALAR